MICIKIIAAGMIYFRKSSDSKEISNEKRNEKENGKGIACNRYFL